MSDAEHHGIPYDNTVTATGGAPGNAVTFTSTTPPICTVSGTSGSNLEGQGGTALFNCTAGKRLLGLHCHRQAAWLGHGVWGESALMMLTLKMPMR